MNEEKHLELMKAILKSIKDKPLALKGGTALMLGYGLDRFSEDIDLDVTTARKGRGTINLTSTLKNLDPNLNINFVKIKKDSDTVTRYTLKYDETKYLRIEISYRNPVDKNSVSERNGPHRRYSPI